MRRLIWMSGLLCLLLGAGWYASSLGPQKTDTLALAENAKHYPAERGWIQRTFPHFTADADAYRKAIVQAQTLRAAAKTSRFGAWQPVGPTNIGGRITDVEFNPFNPDILYAAAATGGVFKSTDTGRSWQPIFDDQPILSIGDIAVDPVNPQTIYVGTGEANGGHNNFAGTGLYKSVNGGQTWSFSGLDRTATIGRVLVDPTDSERLFVAAVGSYFAPNPDRGVYRSLDGGDSWEQVLFVNDSTGVVDLVMRPDSTDVLFAAAWQRVRRPTAAALNGEASGVYKSIDGGATWTRLGPEQGLPADPAGRIGLAVSPSDPDVVYALFTDGFDYLGFYRTDDGGTTWVDADPDDELRTGFGGFSWYFGQVRIAPDDPNHVYVMDVLFMQSFDGGASWSRESGLHVDHHALAFHPDDPLFIVNGNDGGLALSQRGGILWQRVFNLPITQFYEITINPHDPTQFFGGTQDNGTLQSDGSNGWHHILGGDGFYVIVDPQDPSIVYAERQHGDFNKITDGRARRAMTGIAPTSVEKRNWSTPVVMDPNNPNVLYYGTTRVYRTEDAAETWTAISGDLTRRLGYPLLGTLTTLAVSPFNPDVLYAGTDDGNVWVSEDYGETWNNIADDLPMRWVTRIVVDPFDDHTAYVTFSGLRWQDPQPHVFRTRDRGATWEDLTANLPDAPVNAFAVDPINTDYLYLGNDIGAFMSVDGGGSWAPLGDGLPAVSVYDLKIYQDETQRFLLAGTHGRSMYTLDLADVPTATRAEEPNPTAVALAPGYPNPFTHRTTLSYHLPERADVRLDVYDLLGRRLTTLVQGPAPPGTHTTAWEAAGFAAGTYVVRLTATTATGTSVQTRMLVRSY